MSAPNLQNKPKKPAPFSLRLSEAEKARLLRRAKGKPLGRYIKNQLFTLGSAKHRADLSKADLSKADCASVLGQLGQSDLATSMARIAKAARIGALPVTPELIDKLHMACADIRIMRRILVRALGLRTK